jgi:hypothetical protein
LKSRGGIHPGTKEKNCRKTASLHSSVISAGLNDEPARDPGNPNDMPVISASWRRYPRMKRPLPELLKSAEDVTVPGSALDP